MRVLPPCTVVEDVVKSSTQSAEFVSGGSSKPVAIEKCCEGGGGDGDGHSSLPWRWPLLSFILRETALRTGHTFQAFPPLPSRAETPQILPAEAKQLVEGTLLSGASRVCVRMCAFSRKSAEFAAAAVTGNIQANIAALDLKSERDVNQQGGQGDTTQALNRPGEATAPSRTRPKRRETSGQHQREVMTTSFRPRLLVLPAGTLLGKRASELASKQASKRKKRALRQQNLPTHLASGSS